MKKLILISGIAMVFGHLAHASSGYGARTNQEMNAVMTDALGRFDSFNEAIESITHDVDSKIYGTYIVKTSESCSYIYNAVRGSTESDGLLGVNLISKKCQ